MHVFECVYFCVYEEAWLPAVLRAVSEALVIVFVLCSKTSYLTECYRLSISKLLGWTNIPSRGRFCNALSHYENVTKLSRSHID